MSMFGGQGDGGAASMEAARQARIKQGQAQIDKVFGGGSYGYGAATGYNPDQTYYDSNGNVFNVPAGTKDPAAYMANAIKGGNIFTNRGTSEGFTDDFYNQRAKDYENYATPQLMDQFRTTRNNLTYALARTGAASSSSGINRNASLRKQMALNENTIANEGQDQVNKLRGDVTSQKGQLLQELESSSDPTAIQSQATAAASQLRAPSPLQPLGNLFADWSQQYLAGKQAQAYQPSIWDQLSTQGFGTSGGGSGGSGGGSSYMVA